MTDAALPRPAATPAFQRRSMLRMLLRDKPATIAAVFLILVVAAALLAPYLSPFDPYANNLRLRLKPPTALHWLGTDEQGRDMLSRLLYGLRTTLGMGVLALAAGGSVGVVLGLLAAYYRTLDGIIMRIVDVLLSFPAILFALAIAAVLGANTTSITVALAVTTLPTVARMTRGAGTVVMQQEYMMAGRSIGLSDFTIIWRYLALNCVSAVLVFLTLQLGNVILIGAALSFIGLGAQPPTAELGTMAASGRNFLFLAPHVSTIPSVAIFVIVLAFNVLGDACRDMLDPRFRQ
jgi:ABC-type dipeptide/oligopeptide/nickel transport system permease subunit